MVKKQKMRAQKQWDVFWKMILQYLKIASFWEMSKYSTQVHCAWFITVQQITVIMQQILQIMEKPGRMEKVWKNCWGLRRIWENISALSLQQRMEVYLSGQICLLTGTMKMHRQQPTMGKRILRMTT